MFPKNFILALSVLAITCAVFATSGIAIAATHTFYLKEIGNYFGPTMSVNVSLDKDTYSPSESMTITGKITNNYYYSSWADNSSGTASLNYGVNTSANNILFANSAVNYNIGGGINYIGPKSISATAPSSAGTYYVNFSGKGEIINVYENYKASLAGSYSIPFTVKEPEVANPTCNVYFDKSSINVGEQSTLYWSSTNASSARISCVGPIPLSETDLPTINNGSVGPVTFTSAGPETCSIAFKNSAGKAITCFDTLPVNSVATPSCSMSWNPEGPITSPSNSTITASFTNAAKYDWSCSGINNVGPFTNVSVPSTNSAYADVNFSSGQSGTQTCTVTPKNSSGTPGTSCSKTLTVNSGNGTWSDWSACSRTCGGGTQTRTCSIPDSGFGPAVSRCSGSSSRSCNTQACSTNAPTATLTSDKTTVDVGDWVTLTWRSTGGSSYRLANQKSNCSNSNSNNSGYWDNDWNGSFGMPIDSYLAGCTLVYTYTVTGSGGTASDSVQINVNSTQSPATISATCSVSPASGSVGTEFTWSANSVTGGTGSYTYSWSGTDGLSGTGQSVRKSYSSAGSKTGSVAITSGGNTQTVTCYSSTTNSGGGSGGSGGGGVTVGPDLTAGSVSPTSATAGTAKTFSAVISNTNASTGAGFTNLFQRATDSGGTGATSIGTYTQSTALAVDGSATMSLSYTFGSSGTYYLRVCADKSSSSNTGTIAESDEGNNCGGWTTVTVSPAPVAPTVTFSASPERINVGQSSTLTWSSTNATSCNGTGFSISGTSGSASVSPAITSTYQVNCSGNGGSASKNATVTVRIPTVSIDASPKRINKGSQTTISWVVTDASTCSITKNGDAWKSLTANDEGELRGSDNHAPQTQTIYKISCSGVEDSVTVNVNSDFEEF